MLYFTKMILGFWRFFMSDQVRDMTTGSPSKLILLFAVPLMLGNVCQQLYTMVDTAIL